jgi:cholesterol transport system auxiliary component
LKRIALLLIVSGLCTACVGSVLKSDNEAPDLYRLAAPPASGTNAGAGPVLTHAITVARPRSASSLDTERIAVTTPGHGFDYLAGARWADTAPQMVQQMLVDMLIAGGRFATAVAAPSRVPTDLLLEVELRHFEAIYASVGEPPRVLVELQGNLVDVRRGARVASFASRAEATAARNDRTAVIAAFEDATAEAARDAALRASEAAAAYAR